MLLYSDNFSNLEITPDNKLLSSLFIVCWESIVEHIAQDLWINRGKA